MVLQSPGGPDDCTAHVFAEHRWTELRYVLSDLLNSVAADHQAEHEQAAAGIGRPLHHPHRHAVGAIDGASLLDAALATELPPA